MNVNNRKYLISEITRIEEEIKKLDKEYRKSREYLEDSLSGYVDELEKLVDMGI